MSVLVIPNILVNGSGPANIVDANGLNANFNAIASAVNNLYASQMIPLTSIQATFGGVTGYTFPPTGTGNASLSVSGTTGQTGPGLFVNSFSTGNWVQFGSNFLITSTGQTQVTTTNTAVTPLAVEMIVSQSVPGLLINGAASISGNLIEADLTSGGAKAFAVSSGGITQAVSGVPNSLSVLSGNLQTGGTLAQLSGEYLTYDFQGIQAHNGTSSSPLNLNPLGGGVVAGAQIMATSFALSSTTAAANLLSDGTNLFIRSYSAGGTFFFQNSAGTSLANINGSTGNYTATSDAELKENVIDLALGLDDLLRLRPVRYDWISTKAQSQGFIAQEVRDVVPLAVSSVNEAGNILGISDSLLTPVVVKAIQQFYAEFKAYAAAHP